MTTAPPPLEVVYAPDEQEADRSGAGQPWRRWASSSSRTMTGPGSPTASPTRSSSARARCRSPLDRALCERRGFTGKAGRTLVALGTGEAPTVVHIGCGDARKFELDDAAARRRRLRPGRRPVGDRRGGAAGVVDGRDGTVTPTGAPPKRWPREPSSPPTGSSATRARTTEGRVDRLVVLGPGLDADAARRGIERGTRIARAVCLARDLVNEPPSTMTPRRLAEIAEEELDAQAAVTLEVWDEQRIADERLGGLLGVARGSAEPPRSDPGHLRTRPTRSRSTAGCPTWCSWARGSPSTRAGSRSRRPVG